MRRQIFGGFCGPAILEHYINIYGYHFNQGDIACCISHTDRIKEKGSTPEELGYALNILTPALTFWLKYSASWRDVVRLLSYYKYPRDIGVGLDIQGFFVDQDFLTPGSIMSLKLINENGRSEIIELNRQELIKVTYAEDNGHYIIATNIYDNGQVRYLDPSFSYPRYINQGYLLMRWWDVEKDIYERTMMIVTRKNDNFPETLGMFKYPA